MPGVSFVSVEYYRRHLEALKYWLKKLDQVDERHRRGVAAKVRFCSRCLMQSDCAEATDADREEVFSLIDRAAGELVRRQLDAAAVRRQMELEALSPVERCKCGRLTTGTTCDECSRSFLATLESLMK